MDIKWLKTFIIAAEYENFRMASEKLFLAQPTITVHIGHLEELLGISLFDKKGRNVVLTHAGKRFLSHAKQIVESYERGIGDLESWRQGYKRKLTIAVSPLIAASVLPPLLQRFVQRYADIEISVNVRESIDIPSLISQGQADIGLSRIQPVHPAMTGLLLYKDPVCLIAPHDGGEQESAPPEISELLTRNRILTHNHPGYWDDLLITLRSRYPRIRTMAVSQVHITKRFIEEGLGVSFLPRSTVRREVIEGRVMEVFIPDMELPTAATYLLYQSLTEEVVLFRDFLRGYYPYLNFKS